MPCRELCRCVDSINCQFIILTDPIHVNVISDSDHTQSSDSDSTYDLNPKARVLCWEQQLRLAAALPCRNFEIQASHIDISISKCKPTVTARPSSRIHLKVSPWSHEYTWWHYGARAGACDGRQMQFVPYIQLPRPHCLTPSCLTHPVPLQEGHADKSVAQQLYKYIYICTYYIYIYICTRAHICTYM